MSIFTKILEKLGIKKDTSAPASTPGGASTGPSSAGRPSGPTASKPGATAGPARPVAPANVPGPRAVSEVDVVKKLEDQARGSGLNWKVSIVDLLKLLDIDSSREARNELAKELGCPPELMSDSAKMNVWLHKAVLKKIAENGGNIPQSLLD